MTDISPGAINFGSGPFQQLGRFAQLAATSHARGANNLRAEVFRMQGERQQLAPNRARHIGGVGNAANRLRAKLGRDATMRVAQADQAAPTSFRGALNQATRRMRARQGIVNRGEAAIGNQALRDRIQVARTNASRRGAIHNALQQESMIREGVNTGVSNANQRIAESQSSMFGSLAGAATSFMMNNRPGTQGDPNQSLNQGTAAADIMNQSGPVFNGGDPFAAPPVVYG